MSFVPHQVLEAVSDGIEKDFRLEGARQPHGVDVLRSLRETQQKEAAPLAEHVGKRVVRLERAVTSLREAHDPTFEPR
jgi:hypothetical protein